MHFIAIFLFGISSFAWGELFQITNRNYGALSQAVVDPIFDQLEAEVNNNLPDASATTYLSGIANATVTSSAGLGTDYSSAYGIALLGASVGIGADLGTTSLGSISTDELEQIGGVSSQAAVTIGFDPKILFKARKRSWLSRTKFYLHFLDYNFSYENFSGGLTSFGVAGQYKLVRPYRAKFGYFRWGGIDLTTGIKKSSVSLNLRQSVTESVSDTVTMTFDGVANVGANVNVWTVPIEISTSTRLLYILSLYAGLAADISFGSSKSIASISGPVTVSEAGVSADAELDLGEDASPDAFSGRYFAGVALDFTAFAVHAQFSQSFSNSTLGINVGLKAFW